MVLDCGSLFPIYIILKLPLSMICMPFWSFKQKYVYKKYQTHQLSSIPPFSFVLCWATLNPKYESFWSNGAFFTNGPRCSKLKQNTLVLMANAMKPHIKLSRYMVQFFLQRLLSRFLFFTLETCSQCLFTKNCPHLAILVSRLWLSEVTYRVLICLIKSCKF